MRPRGREGSCDANRHVDAADGDRDDRDDRVGGKANDDDKEDASDEDNGAAELAALRAGAGAEAEGEGLNLYQDAEGGGAGGRRSHRRPSAAVPPVDEQHDRVAPPQQPWMRITTGVLVQSSARSNKGLLLPSHTNDTNAKT
ncbi:hypothetical protein EX895_001630 [Sporisorium graminicola]|uniref:Uncharacterized protein n=1 Tax=Sporisorium graminicola TaxID=280036 RepID=A0A4V6EU39_9BASI|nr:hypothetical protein EX895_001630 [Sporisorium graminicola]TKY89099.1 hypothetical protein EX895_001630 [Sporisorium graminicola]